MHISSLKTIGFSRCLGLFFVCGFLLTGCQSQNLTKITIVDRVFYLESAQSSAQKIKGLSGRNKLGADRGMIFLYDKPEIQSFWMKDTLIPLQIIFINDCEIIDVQEMSAENNPADPQNKYVSGSIADRVIELNKNSLPENIVGQKIDQLCN